MPSLLLAPPKMFLVTLRADREVREVREGGAQQEQLSTYGELCETRQMIET